MRPINTRIIPSQIVLWLSALACAGVPACECSHDDGLERVHLVETMQLGTFGEMRKDIIGYLKNGKKHGQWATYWDGVLEEIVTWRDGVKHGPDFAFFEDGSISIDTYNLGGKVHGRWRSFNEHGRLVELGWWRYSQRVGIWCYWDDSGRLTKLENYYSFRSTDYDEIENPAGECPLTETRLGRHHFDPANRNYRHPYGKSRPHGRYLPALR